jgi:hypothetical protein
MAVCEPVATTADHLSESQRAGLRMVFLNGSNHGVQDQDCKYEDGIGPLAKKKGNDRSRHKDID